jgi:photosystem II stability/assembly factor-like uncharacterized protein
MTVLSRKTAALLAVAAAATVAGVIPIVLLLPGGVANAATGNWSAQNPATSGSLDGVSFVNGADGWAVGINTLSGKGVILATQNGGSAWVNQTPPTVDAGLTSVSFVDALHGWAVGDAGTILATTDGGQSWTAESSGYPTANFIGVSFVDASHGWVVGSLAGTGSVILATTDGGVTWTNQTNPPIAEVLRGIWFVDANHGWVVGNNGTILATGNGGGTWAGTGASGTGRDLEAVTFVDPSHGWVVGSGGTILSTIDGGATWSAQPSGTGNILNAVSFVDASHGWVVGQTGVILATTNGGATWSAQSSGTDANLAGVSFVDTGHGWAVGYNVDLNSAVILAFQVSAPLPTGTMNSSPSSGPVGTQISVTSVTPCPAGSTFAEIYFKSSSGETEIETTAPNFSSSGAWSGTVTVPTSSPSGQALPSGSYFLTASCYGTSFNDATQNYTHNPFTVTPTLQTITVAPSNPSIPQGTTQQFTATGTYSDGSTKDITSSANWKSSNSSVATINGSGLATAVGQGTTTVSATSDSVSGSTTLTVTAPLPTITGFSPASGPPGTRVTITGAHFVGTTVVKFNGTPATTFTVQSDSKITTKVPKGATTGPISVTTATGTATSASSFVVK